MVQGRNISCSRCHHRAKHTRTPEEPQLYQSFAFRNGIRDREQSPEHVNLRSRWTCLQGLARCRSWCLNKYKIFVPSPETTADSSDQHRQVTALNMKTSYSVSALLCAVELAYGQSSLPTTTLQTAFASPSTTTSVSASPTQSLCIDPGWGAVVQEHPFQDGPSAWDRNYIYNAPAIQDNVTSYLGFGYGPDGSPLSYGSIYGGNPMNLTGKAVQHWTYFRPKLAGQYFVQEECFGGSWLAFLGQNALSNFGPGGQLTYKEAYDQHDRSFYLGPPLAAGQILPIRIFSIKGYNIGNVYKFRMAITGPVGPNSSTIISDTVSGEEYFFRSCQGQSTFRDLGSRAVSTSSTSISTSTTTALTTSPKTSTTVAVSISTSTTRSFSSTSNSVPNTFSTTNAPSISSTLRAPQRQQQPQ